MADETNAGGLTALKVMIRDLGDMACLGCRNNTCAACAVAADVTSSVHVLVAEREAAAREQGRAEADAAWAAAVREIIDARHRGDFSAILPKLDRLTTDTP